jgi:AcrR family transcriptional regulator
MIAEARSAEARSDRAALSNRAALSAPGRRVGALYPKLRPGPRSCAGEGVESNQRARLYGAMIELVAARGYTASTVAELCALAGVSKRTLYERFPGGKEECFIATYDIVVRSAQARILAAARRGPEAFSGARPPARPPAGPLKRLRAVVQAFAHEVAVYPNAARLVVVEARDAGPVALARVEATRRLAERVIASSLRQCAEAPPLSSLAVRGIAGEGARLTHARLLDGRVAELAGELSDLCVAVTASLLRAPGGYRHGRSARLAGVPGEKPLLALERVGD